MSVVPDQLRLLAEDVPGETAYRVDGVGAMTFAEWQRSSNRLARGLQERGITPGDRVVELFDPTAALTQLVTHVAVHKAGAVNVPMSSQLARGEIATLVRHVEPHAAIVSEAHVHLVDEVLGELGVDLVVTTGSGRAGRIGWDTCLADDESDVQADIDEDAVADIVYTSGTTGRPKAVLSRHRNALQLPVDRPQWSGLNWFHASPLTTTAGLSFIFVPMRLGMTGVYQPGFDPAGFLDLVESGEVQMAFLVPAMVELLLAQEDFADRDLSTLQLVTVGGAPSAPTSLLTLDDELPNGSVLNSFALTESGAAKIVMPAHELRARPESVGRPLPPTEVRIVDEDGEDLPPRETGEVLLRTPGQQREYFRDEKATRDTWREGWLYTGDLGRLDEDGFLYVVGRRKDVIIRGGHNVHAADVEAVLYEHPAVAEAAVVGVPHDVLGEDVAAAVVAQPGGDVDADALVSWCEERLARHKVPRTIEVRDALPRTESGKVKKDVLRDEHAP